MMKKILAIVILLLITACSTTVPVVAKFPEGPGRTAMESCPNLQKLNDDAKLSDVAKTVTLNYTTYYECAVKVDGWKEWYNTQKIIFESIK
jgi:hypothetical protein